MPAEIEPPTRPMDEDSVFSPCEIHFTLILLNYDRIFVYNVISVNSEYLREYIYVFYLLH